MDLDDGWNGIASASVFAPNSSTSRWAVSSNVGSSSHNGAPNPPRHKTVACKYWLMGGCRRSAQECNFVHPVETFEETSEHNYWDKVAEIFGTAKRKDANSWSQKPELRQKCDAYNEKSVVTRLKVDFMIVALLKEQRAEAKLFSPQEYKKMQEHLARLLFKQDYYRAQCEVLRRLASEEAFRANNKRRPPYQLDLHSLNVAEAVAKFGEFLEGSSDTGLARLMIITGKPRTSEGICHIGLAVRAYCMRVDVKCEQDSTNTGVLLVYPGQKADPELAQATTGI